MDTSTQAAEMTSKVPPLERPIPALPPLQAFWGRYGSLIITGINLSIFLIIWQLVQGGDNPIIDNRFVPTPLAMFEALIKDTLRGTIPKHAVFSATNYIVGMTISIVIAVPLGILLGLNPTIRSIAQTYVWIGYSTPNIAIQPIIVVILGFGIESKIFLVTMMSFFPIMVNTLAGVATVDPILVKAGTLFGANRQQLFRKIIIPSTLPWIMTGLRLASRRGLIAVIIGEIFGSIRGLAFMIIREAEKFDSASSFGAIAVLMVISLIIINGMAWAETRATPWRVAYRI